MSFIRGSDHLPKRRNPGEDANRDIWSVLGRQIAFLSCDSLAMKLPVPKWESRGETGDWRLETGYWRRSQSDAIEIRP